MKSLLFYILIGIFSFAVQSSAYAYTKDEIVQELCEKKGSLLLTTDEYSAIERAVYWKGNIGIKNSSGAIVCCNKQDRTAFQKYTVFHPSTNSQNKAKYEIKGVQYSNMSYDTCQ